MSRFNPRGFVVQPLEAEGEAVVIHAEAVEDGGVEISDVDGVFENIVGVIIGGAVAETGFDPATGDPCAEAATLIMTC